MSKTSISMKVLGAKGVLRRNPLRKLLERKDYEVYGPFQGNRGPPSKGGMKLPKYKGKDGHKGQAKEIAKAQSTK